LDAPAVTKRRASPTTWKRGQSGNPAGRAPGAELVRQLLEPKRKELVERAIELAMAGDAQVMRALLDRLAPAPRSQHPAVLVAGLPEAATLTEKATAIVNAMGRGEISPDAGALMLGAVASAVRIVESEDLAARIAALEAMQAGAR
jgi:hypothetical protein